ncbi:MAG: hypothetical protein CVU98_00345 [Firmicutes bacterium HGW-Firmicutes-3]|jgi:hypothetical protein|nr:MAG: hypothetical protein CVU98_00345 [Firmicutes bacterium HGW-Firmicutes-3]
MKKIKVVLVFVMVLMLMLGSISFGSVTVTPIDYTGQSSGNSLIYSDSPERFGLQNSSLVYLYGRSLGTSYKDVEYYHWLNNNSTQYDKCRIGVAIQNTTSSSVTITYKGAHTSLDVSATASNIDTLALGKTPAVLVNYLNASTKTITIQAGKSAIVWANDFQFKPGHQKFVFGRGQFKSSKSTGVYLRVFAAGQTKTAAEVFSVATPVAGESNHFCGEVNYTQKNLNINVNTDLGKVRLLSEWMENKNIREYYGVTSYKSGTNPKLGGNFGVIYNISIANPAGKKIYIIPKWSDGNKTKASAVFKLNNNAWEAATVISNNGADDFMNNCWVRSLGTSTTATFKFILPGGNSGNYYVLIK